MSVDGSGHPNFVAAQGGRPMKRGITAARAAAAVRTLFAAEFGTVEIAALLVVPEAAIVEVVHGGSDRKLIEARDG